VNYGLIDGVVTVRETTKKEKIKAIGE
jgi:hypothetical protein